MEYRLRLYTVSQCSTHRQQDRTGFHLIIRRTTCVSLKQWTCFRTYQLLSYFVPNEYLCATCIKINEIQIPLCHSLGSVRPDSFEMLREMLLTIIGSSSMGFSKIAGITAETIWNFELDNMCICSHFAYPRRILHFVKHVLILMISSWGVLRKLMRSTNK